jgi:geranylgeranyl pyrophosphate synthase
MRAPQPLSSLQVLEIFRQKTAPAFEVALQIGAAYAGAEEDILEILSRYSEALGIAYQIRDDIEDLTVQDAPDDIAALRPSLPLALAYERAKGEDKARVEYAWRPNGRIAHHPAVLRRLLSELKVEDRCHQLLDSYKEEAVRTLPQLRNASLKGLLRRVIGKIFTVEIKGWCGEFEARNAAGGEAVAETAR